MALSLWEFLFKYPPLVFEKGRVVFASPLPGWLIAVAVAVAVVAAWSYVERTRGLKPHDRVGMLLLRGALLTLLLLLLLRPTLQVPVAVEQENYLGILVDDSRSMLVADDGTITRAESLVQQLDRDLLARLSEKYRLRLFSFAGDTRRVSELGELSFVGGQTRIGRALEQARSELAGVPVAGLVVISDGADQSEVELNNSLLGLRTSSIPVSTVGIGREQFQRDIEIRRVSSPRAVLRGTSMLVDVVIAQSGYAGQTIPLIVEDEGQVVNVQEVVMPIDGAPASVRVHFTAENGGWHRFKFRVPLQDGELISENNERETLVEVREGRQKVLYLEGEPRFEVKFMRRAVADDPELQLVVLQRTAENKFLRLDVDDGEELASGFPTTREELFQYRSIVLGSVEASFFTREQLQIIVDFVSERGGSILFLGGKRSFTEGGYANTALAPLLPVELEETPDPNYYRELKVQPTRAGLAHAALRLVEDADSSAARWATLPELSTFNRLTRLKPGATALLTGMGAGVSEGQVVLASQRYGRGMTLALPVQDTWIWQMHADIPLEDQTHETFWRQIFRWLVNEVPDQMTVTPSTEPTTVGQTVQFTADLRDRRFTRINDASVVALIDLPDGNSTELPLRWTNREDGEYTASFVPAVPGIHQIRVRAVRGEEDIALGALALDAVEDDGEFYGAQMRAPLLRRIAEETGGRFYALNDIARLADDVQYSGSGITRVESYDLWDMPFIFFLLVGFIGGEWVFRRMRGLP
ncbi:MAG TPA: filamin/ABP280 repeat domain-containing protein [Longimicrobiaceae bacterium]|nr:filamin/ABP280 repeat domain-containing protein [Longimicrobiaceae bacterium]